uniref:hypothetical protein n=1 Tax=Sphingomonas bacterium TaxID=1895847 RepID=UPI00157659C6
GRAGREVRPLSHAPRPTRAEGAPAGPALPRAEIGLGGGKLAAEAEAAGLPGGIPVNRLMLRWRIPLGRKPK